MIQQLKEFFPNCSINNNVELLQYGAYATQFLTEEPPEKNIDLYSNMVAKGLDASRSNLAINIQYNTSMGQDITTRDAGSSPFKGALQLYLFPVVCKSFEYINGSFNYM